AIDANPQNWAGPAAARALMKLVERGDSVVVAILHESGGKEGADSKYGEGYGEYVGYALSRCRKFCDRGVLFAHLVHNVTDVPDLRLDGLGLFATIYGDPGFSTAQREKLHSVFIAAAADSTSFLTRAAAMSAIGAALRSGLPSSSDQRRLHQAALH